MRTSQNLTTPSALTLHSSASLVGLKATFSTEAVWPLSSVENLTFGFSGFPFQCIKACQNTIHSPAPSKEFKANLWRGSTYTLAASYLQIRWLPMCRGGSRRLREDCAFLFSTSTILMTFCWQKQERIGYKDKAKGEEENAEYLSKLTKSNLLKEVVMWRLLNSF